MVTATGPTPGQDTNPGRQHGWRRALDREDLHRYLTTLEGWREFTTQDPAPADLLTENQLTDLDDDGRLDYDDVRLDYHTRLTVAATSTLRTVVHAGRRLTLLDRHAISARRGLILSGAAGTGKTTALTQFGKTIEVIDRRQHPGVDRIPVGYVTVPPAATSRMLAVEFARFLGLPVTTRANITDVIEAVCGVLIDARVSVVCVDELHNLSLATRNGAEVSDTLKYFSERIPATFVYAGVDLEANGLFNGTRGRQIAGRFAVIDTIPFPRTAEWTGLVSTFEEALRLHHHQHKTLEGLAHYLHQRTGGMIGSLSHLIRGAAIDAILDGTEKITRKFAGTRQTRPRRPDPHDQIGFMTTSVDDGDRLRPLPARPRPKSGESTDSYIRRLARANHLKPSYLRGYLAGTRLRLRNSPTRRPARRSDRTSARRARTGTARPRRKEIG